MLKPFFLVFSVFFSCRSALSHQPISFPAYFPQVPTESLSPERLEELHALEAGGATDALVLRRLRDLYQLEIHQLRPSSLRYVQVKTAVERLKPSLNDGNKDIEALHHDIRELRLASPPSSDPPRITIQDRMVKRAYDRALHHWNQQAGDRALKEIDRGLKIAEKRQPRREDRFKLLALKVRIGIEFANLQMADAAYAEAKEALACTGETAELGFLVSLGHFSQNESARALEIFRAQCDPDESPSNRLKRAYWEARFQQTEGRDLASLYGTVLQSPMPGYYYYLASAQAKQKIRLPEQSGLPSYLASELRVSSEVTQLIAAAETRLRVPLRKDAELFLLKATYLLKGKPDEDSIRALLYIAHLLQAAGSPLEAMRLYAMVTTFIQGDAGLLKKVPVDFLREMFPRPHVALVEPVAKQWDADSDFVYAIMRQESAFHPGARSFANARGLMQLLPRLARALSRQWRYDNYYSDKGLFVAAENIKLAVYHLHELKPKAPHVALMAASYNAGYARVRKWWQRFGDLPLDVFVEMIPVTETRNYVKLVLRNFILYKALRSNGPLDPSVIELTLPPFAG